MTLPQKLTSPIQTAKDFQAAFDVSRETIDRLEIYAEQLVLWQAKINLVSPKTLDQAWHRHFADSAQLLSLIPKDAQSWVDVGSGGGFPGLVMAILLSDQDRKSSPIRVSLVESDSRKAAFLREVARQAMISVDICNERIELSTNWDRIRHKDVYSARAFAPLSRLFRDVSPLFSASSTGFFLKGRSVAEEITEAQRLWKFDVQLVESITDPDGRIVVVSNLNAKTEG
ncbi:MAG: 16S rRNA (guanine(527)-N(7))-methyltransferase RsmG [Hyphomicrobiaceae bacterium]